MFYRFYDALFAGKDYAGEIARVLAIAGIGRPVRVLEIGAGTGNHTRVLAEAGHHVTAVDIDPRMVEIARAKLAGLPVEVARRIEYVLGRVEELEARDFELGLALFNVVNYLERLPALEGFLGAVAVRLRPGAAFLFDAWNGVAALLDPPKDKQTVAETPTHRVRAMLTSRTDPLALRSLLYYELEAEERATGRIERGTYELAQTFWPPKVISDAAEAAGLQLCGVYALDDVTRPAIPRDWKILFVTRR